VTLRGRVATGVAWAGGARWLGLASGLVTTTILARLLVPADYAVMVAAGAVAGFVGLVQESGLAAAVIHHAGDDDTAATTAFLMHLVGATLGFALCVAATPWLAAFFQIEQRWALAAAFAPVWLAAWTGVPTARLDKALAFRRSACVQVAPALVYPCVSVPLAALGAGPWALVLGQIAASAAAAATAWSLVAWRPRRRHLDWATGRALAAYGRPILGSNLLGRLNDQIDNWVTGRLFGPAALGLYAMAFRLATLPRTGITFAVSDVLFPALAHIRDDRPRLRRAFLRSLHWIAVLSVPASVGLAVLAPALVAALLGPRWTGTVPPARVLAGFGLLASLSATTGDLFKAVGRSALIWRIGLVHSATLWVGLAVLGRYGLSGVALAVMLATVASCSTAFVAACMVLELRARDVVAALGGPVVASGVMAAVLLAVPPLGVPTAPAFVAATGVGIVVYAAVLAVLAPGDVREVLSLLATVRRPRFVRAPSAPTT
jgi:O-antigen/teichoic acid export membrane protein